MPELKQVVGQITPEAYKENAEFYKFLLEERKDAREDSWTRRSGVLLTGLLVPIVTGFLTFYGTNLQRQETLRQQTVQIEETKRKAEEETTKRHVENARLALQIYVQNPVLFDRSKNSDAVFHVRMIAVISDNEELKRLFEEMLRQHMSDEIAKGSTPEQAATNLPDRIITTTASGYNYPSFIAYVQAKSEDLTKAQTVVAALRQRGMKVEGVDTKVSAVPSASEIRYYKPQHKEFAERVAADLTAATQERFVAKQLNNPKLPDGIIEIWIGHP